MKYIVEKRYAGESSVQTNFENYNTLEEAVIEQNLESITFKLKQNKKETYYIGRICTDEEIRLNSFENYSEVDVLNITTFNPVKFIQLSASKKFVIVDNDTFLISDKDIKDEKFVGDIDKIKTIKKAKSKEARLSVDEYYPDLSHSNSELVTKSVSINKFDVNKDVEAFTLPSKNNENISQTTYYLGRMCTPDECSKVQFKLRYGFTVGGLTDKKVKFLKTKAGNYYVTPITDVVTTLEDIKIEQELFKIRQEIIKQRKESLNKDSEMEL